MKIIQIIIDSDGDTIGLASNGKVYLWSYAQKKWCLRHDSVFQE